MASNRSGICVVGACFTDLIAYTPRIPGPGETLEGSKFSTGFGGKGANQAVQAARLGANVMMVSKLGDDTFGADTLRNFQEQGVDASNVGIVPGMSSGVAPITVDQTTGQNSIIIVPGALDQLAAQDVEKARTQIRARKLMICQLEAPLQATMAALRVAKEEGVQTLLNTAPAKQLPDEIWQYCDIVCPNEPELQMLTGLPTDTNERVEAAVQVLLNKGAKRVLVTLGEKGCGLFDGGAAPRFVPTKQVSAVDTTGAGDSFLGALAAHIVAGASIDEAMAKANAVAAVSVTREGTQKSYPNAEEMAAREKGLPYSPPATAEPRSQRSEAMGDWEQRAEARKAELQQDFLGQLLEAEWRAESIKSKAKTAQKDKQSAAKAEATEQLDAYKAEQQASLDEVTARLSATDVTADAQAANAEELQMVDRDYQCNKDATVTYIIGKIRDVNLALTPTQILALTKKRR